LELKLLRARNLPEPGWPKVLCLQSLLDAALSSALSV